MIIVAFCGCFRYAEKVLTRTLELKYFHDKFLTVVTVKLFDSRTL